MAYINLALMACLFLLCGCVELPKPYYPIGTLLPYELVHDSEEANKVRTAKNGDLLFSQTLINAGVLELLDDLPTRKNKRVMNATYIGKKGALFFPTILTKKNENILLACSYDPILNVVPPLFPENEYDTGLCFLTNSIQSKFDANNISLKIEEDLSVDSYFLSSVGGAEISPFSKGISSAYGIGNLSSPVRLRYKTTNIPQKSKLPQIAIRYTTTEDEGLLEIVYLREGFPNKTESVPVRFSTSIEFPHSIDINGAQIELLALKNGILAYRVLSGFPAGKFHLMDLPE